MIPLESIAYAIDHRWWVHFGFQSKKWHRNELTSIGPATFTRCGRYITPGRVQDVKQHPPKKDRCVFCAIA